MSVRIHIQDFQSIRDSELTVDRFTVVTGPNNSGKTAIIRAVSGLFSNASGDAFVRHGAEKFTVCLDFADGKAIKWEKGPKIKPTYTIDGKVIYPGRGVPDEISSVGIQPITIGQNVIWPQIAVQFTGQVFLLDLPGSSVAEAVADVERVGRLTHALKFAESDKRSASTDLKVRRKDARELAVELQSYEGVDDVESAMRAIEFRIHEVDSLVAQSVDLTRIVREMEEPQALLVRYSGLREVPVPDVQLIEQASQFRERLLQASSLRLQLINEFERVSCVSGVRDVRLDDNLVQAAHQVRMQIEGAVRLAAAIRLAKADVSYCQTAVSTTRGVNVQQTADTTAIRIANAIRVCSGFKSRWSECRSAIELLREKLTACEGDYRAVEIDVRDVLEILGMCPVCFKQTEKEEDAHPDKAGRGSGSLGSSNEGHRLDDGERPGWRCLGQDVGGTRHRGHLG